jgi:amino acid adenylation domain-containing protein/FkbM family methyltransferase
MQAPSDKLLAGGDLDASEDVYVFPTSFAQERLWFLDQFDPGNPTYNIPIALRISGPLDVAALKRSLNEIVQRHEALRTTFDQVDDQPAQVIVPELRIDVPLLTGSGQAWVQQLVAEETQRPFDLAQGPLVRATLLKLSAQEHVLLLSMHHIVSDGWSMGVLTRELATLYKAFVSGQPASLPALPVQYADFAAWQRDWLQGEVLASQLAYWRQKLAGKLPLIELPTDRPRPPVQTHRGATHWFVLPRSLADALEALSREGGYTLFMTLLAAFKVLLYRYAGQTDILLGTPIANRNRVEIQGLVGFFVNTLVLRTDLSGDPTFRELLDRVQEVTLEAYDHQDLPFEKLVEELQPQRDPSYNPLFQVMFSLQNTPSSSLQLPGLSVEPMRIGRKTSAFDLFLSMEQAEDGLVSAIEYNTDLFDQATVEEMERQLRRLLEQIVAAPDQPIASYSLVTPGACRLLPDPAEHLPEPAYAPAMDMFTARARAAPGQPAVRQGDQSWTYADLAASADALARTLLAQGLEQGDVVAVYGQRSFGLIASVMAALSSGGVLLSIARNLPASRRRFMLQEAGAKYLLCVGEEQTEGEWGEALASIVLTSVDPHSGRPLEPPSAADLESTRPPKLKPDDAAYIFFTSGTTGTPKGVLGCHKGLSHFITWQRETFAIGPEDRSAQLINLSFDAVLRDIFTPLVSGATLCLPPDEKDLGADRILPWMEREGITLLHTVPALAQTWLTGVPPGVSLRALRYVFFAGEALTSTLVQQWREAFPEAGEIVNFYGATETTLIKSFYQVPGEISPGVQPLGRPMPQTQLLVLEDGRLCGVNEPGEILIRTPFRSRGYINAAKENQQRFVCNPFGDDARDLLYRTGDRGRYRPDGALMFLGRLDDQVKIRGVRVEPGEIEAVLGQHPDLRQVAVLAQPDTSGDDGTSKRLVAYVAPRPARAPTVHGKKRHKLPNNAAVAQLNKNETDFTYSELFGRQVYRRHGITFNDGDCIFDVGANIGLFLLFASLVCENPRLYCFEPNPTVFEILRANASLYGQGTRLFNFGLSDENTQATFSFFSGFSILSGFYADGETEKEAVKMYMLNQRQTGVDGMDALVDEADEILEERFRAKTFTAQLRTLSSVIQEQGIERIDLLKINVEKSELYVLGGIEDGDWPKIKQIVAEVHTGPDLEAILALLKGRGYDCVVEQDTLLVGTDFCYVYATRLPQEERGLESPPPLPTLDEPFISTSELRRFAGQKLPDYMIPAAFVEMESLPLLPNGKVDRQALPLPDAVRPRLGEEYVAPSTPYEEILVEVWQEVLGVEKIGVHDNFFDLGGHSLLATQVTSRVRDRFEIDWPVRALFEAPTIADMGARVEQTLIAEIEALDKDELRDLVFS